VKRIQAEPERVTLDFRPLLPIKYNSIGQKLQMLSFGPPMTSSLVINVAEVQKNSPVIDLSTPFGLERIKIEHVTIDPGQSYTQTIPPKCNHFCYVLSGAGSLVIPGENDDPSLKADDCFSFPSHVDERLYTVHVSGDQIMNLLTFTDVPNAEALALVSHIIDTRDESYAQL
jgi:uncharacterized cupin superfamily protein